MARGHRESQSDIVSEGLYIAAAVTRLSLKNSILVHILAEGQDYDAERFIPDAREALLALADEADADAERTDLERRQASRKYTDSDGTHDYRRRDVRNLKRRRDQSRAVAAELRARAADDVALLHLVDTARSAAWDEVASNIDRTLRIESARPDLDPDYASLRRARMQSLRLVDLPRLRAHRRSAAKRRSEREQGIEPPEPTISAPPSVDPGELE